MMETGERSVSAGGDISSSIIQTGDNNTAKLKMVALPDADAVDIVAVIGELRTLLIAMGGPEERKIGRAIDDADDEVGKSTPDKKEVAGALTRALGYAEKAGGFSDHVDKIRGLVVQVAGWIGSAAPYVAPLLASVGLTAG